MQRSSELKTNFSTMATSLQCYRLFTLEFVMEMYTKRGANSTMDYDWLGMKSKQHLTTELIETRLTKDILLDGIGEMGKKR